MPQHVGMQRKRHKGNNVRIPHSGECGAGHIPAIGGRDNISAQVWCILGHLIAGGDLSLYGLANAVTRHAQDVQSYDRSTELEATGYKIITMQPSLLKRWNEEVSIV